MKSRINNSITVLATGFVVLLLLSLPLFWGRWFCEIRLSRMMSMEWSHVRIQPSGLVPPELENEPNVVTPSEIEARMSKIKLDTSFLGIVDYFFARGPEGRHSNIYYLNKDKDNQSWSWMYFYEKIGQIIFHHTYRERTPDKTLLVRQLQLYAGPEGVSENADKKLGRFIRPIADARAWYARPFILYDKQLHRFFKINFKEKTVTKSPVLGKGDVRKPIQIGRISKLWPDPWINLKWTAPNVKACEGDTRKRQHPGSDYIPVISRDFLSDAGEFLLVLDETGRIDLLDRETLEFAGTAGHLPASKSLFSSKGVVTPKDLLDYEVLPLALSSDHKYRGIFVASVCREGTSLTLAVFDEEGKLIRSDYTKAKEYQGRRIVPSSKAVYFHVPWAPTLTIAKYLLENLHPPILSVASYFTASAFEAASGHRALFILPNSFIAMKGRDDSENFAERFMSALWLILPSIIFAIWLACRVSKDAVVVGLCENARLYWIIGTLAFGLTAYITYRLTRPKITLVTCLNCGLPRRPDMAKCHRCKSDWLVAELIPPAWRVLG